VRRDGGGHGHGLALRLEQRRAAIGALDLAHPAADVVVDAAASREPELGALHSRVFIRGAETPLRDAQVVRRLLDDPTVGGLQDELHGAAALGDRRMPGRELVGGGIRRLAPGRRRLGRKDYLTAVASGRRGRAEGG
jgi:hypothetical protein